MKPLIILMLLAGATLAADDPAGWNGAKWGMTEEQILQALPGQAVRLDPPEKFNHARVHIPTLDLAGASFHVYFVPDEKGGLNSVLLSPEKEPPIGFDFLFQSLQNLLVEKYGQPWVSTEGHNTEIRWSLKTTTITLSRIKFPEFPNLQIISLQYKRKDPDLDKL